jgi:hypothetical protein
MSCADECDFVFCLDTSGTYCRKCGIVKYQNSLYGPQWLVNGSLISDQGDFCQQMKRQGGYTRISRFREVYRSIFNMTSARSRRSQASLQLVQRANELIFKYQVNLDRLNPVRLRHIFKKESEPPLQWHVASELCWRIAGKRPSRPELDQEVVEDLESLFLKIDKVWPKVRNQLLASFGWYRVCFVNYTSLLSFLLRQLGKENEAEFVPPLKQAESIHRQNAMLAAVCAELKWEYLPLAGNILSVAEGGVARPYESHLLGRPKKKLKTKGIAAASATGFKICA